MLLPLIPEGKSGHAAQSLQHALRPPDFVAMDNHFPIAVGQRPLAERFQLGSQLEVVVGLAIVDELHRSGLITQRLLPTGHIDDAQPADAQATDPPRRNVSRSLIGAAMDKGFNLSFERFWLNRFAVEGVDTRYSTHLFFALQLLRISIHLNKALIVTWPLVVRFAREGKPGVPTDTAAFGFGLKPGPENDADRQPGLPQKIVAQQRAAQANPQRRAPVPGRDGVSQAADFIRRKGWGGRWGGEPGHHLRQGLVEPSRQ